MIDRQARDKLAQAIRHFIECFTDNMEFDDAAWEIETKDRAVNEIYYDMWLTYDDLTRHKLEGRHALTEAQLVAVKRAIVFLKSDCEYKWPKWPIYYQIVRPLLALLSWGRLIKRLDRHFHGNGDYDVWPFFSHEDYELSLRSPRYLAGSHNTALQPTSGGNAAVLG